MQKFEKANFTVDTYNEDENYGKFIIEPLERGFGTTIGKLYGKITSNKYFILFFGMTLSHINLYNSSG